MQIGKLKTVQLIHSFTPQEAADFTSLIKHHKRPTLKRLYSSLLKQQKHPEKEFDKAQLFEKVFEKSYQPKQDYLLRNELRLLNNEVYQFLIQKQIQSDINDNPGLRKKFLLAALKERGLYRIFETNYKKELKQSVKNQAYNTTVDLIDEYFNYTKEVKEINTPLYKKVHRLLNDQITHLKKGFVTKLRKIETNRAFIERSLKVVQKNLSVSPLSKTFDLTAPQYNDAYSKYMFLKGSSYHSSGKKKIAQLQEAFELLKSIKKRRIARNKEKVFCLGSTGLEFFLMGEYKKADQYYFKAFEIAAQDNMKHHLPLLFNYVSNLIKLKKYQKGIQLINKYWENIQNNERVYFRFECLRAMCYVYLNKPEQAFQSIPPKISQRPQPQYHYFRFIYSIIFYLRDDIDNAAREMNNFHQTLKKKQSLEVNIKPIVSFFKTFYNIYKKSPPSFKKLYDLQDDLQEFTIQATPEFRDYLPLHWLRGIVQKKLKASDEYN